MGFAAAAGRPAFRGVLVGVYVTANRVGMFAGPALATALAGGLGDRRTYLAGAVLVGFMAAAWVPLRRLAAPHRA
jgi:MFS family permease